MIPKDLYNKEADDFIKNDTEIDDEKLRKIQDDLNSESKQWGRILNLGKKHKQTKRMRSALVNKDVKPPDLVVLLKDHKESRQDGSKPTRPVCMARESPNGVLNNLLSDVADKIGDSLG